MALFIFDWFSTVSALFASPTLFSFSNFVSKLLCFSLFLVAVVVLIAVAAADAALVAAVDGSKGMDGDNADYIECNIIDV